MSRVTLFVDSLASGGAQRQVAEIAQALHDEPSLGWLPSVAWYNDADRFVRIHDGVDAAPIARRGRTDLRFPGRVLNRFGKQRADVIHAFLASPSLYASFARQLGAVPVIAGVRCSAAAFADHRREALGSLASAHLADHTTVNALDVVPWLVERGVPEDRISYIPNLLAAAVNERVPSTAEQRAACLSGYGIDPTTPPITLIGRIDEYKNQDGLLRAVASLVSRNVDVPPVLFVGRHVDEQRLANLRRLAAQPGMPQVVFAPNTPNILTVMESSRLVALASHSEGTPNVVLESLGLGVLVMATPVGQVPELIPSLKTGFVTRDTSDEALAATLQAALQCPAEQVATIQAAARDDMRDRFGRRAISRRLTDLYADVVKRPRRPRPTAAWRAMLNVAKEWRAGGIPSA